MIRKSIPEDKLRKNTTTLVRLGNEYVKTALKLKKKKKVHSVGKLVEDAIAFYDNFKS